MSNSLLIKNGLIITMNSSQEIIKDNVYVEGNRIVEIGSGKQTADKVIDASGCLVLPGFIQNHVHLNQTLFRGLAEDMNVMDWLRLRIWPLEQAHNEKSIYDSSRLSLAEMIHSGTTCALTNETLHHTNEVFRAATEIGFRLVGGKIMMDRWEPGTEMVGETTRKSIKESLSLLKKFNKSSGGKIRYAFCPRGPRNCSRDLWNEILKLSDEHDVLIHTHAAENKTQSELLASKDGMTDVSYLHSIDATNPRLVLAHCVWVDESEIEVLSNTGTKVAHCPSTNMKLASGIAPIPDLLDRGVTVGLGSDGAPANNNLDIFREMRLASFIQKPRKGPLSMPALSILKMATIGGAKVLGLEKEIGSIEIGKLADIVLIRRDVLHAQPNTGSDPISQIVYEHKSSDVDTVIIDGNVLLQEGELTRLDQAEIMAHAKESRRGLIDRAGLSF